MQATPEVKEMLGRVDEVLHAFGLRGYHSVNFIS